mmetsp:Transcript_31178/g.47717  ORF Transcript_31178/g.47717 Transcript_31178/m.47717 type:complete len:252 (+) Transcript_31178:1591-2346(+)
MRLPLFNPLMQEVHSFVILLLEFGLDALVLQPTHLELESGVILLVELGQSSSSLASSAHIGSVPYGRVVPLFHEFGGLLSLLSLLVELNIVLVEYHLLDIWGGLLAHVQALTVSFFVALDNLVFEAQELEDLLEHCRLNGALNAHRPGQLRTHLLGVDFDALGAISELFQLIEYLAGVSLELLLEHLQSLLIVQLLAGHDPRLVAEETIDLGEQVLGRSRAVLEVHTDAVLRVVAQYEYIVPLQLLSDYSS